MPLKTLEERQGIVVGVQMANSRGSMVKRYRVEGWIVVAETNLRVPGVSYDFLHGRGGSFHGSRCF
jgi:hypothetical protein